MILKIKDLKVSVNSNTVLEDVNLEFGTGIHFIMGPNGAGKSTLGHAIMGNPLYDVSGEIVLNRIHDENLLDYETYVRAQKGIFLSFQNPTPIEGLSNYQLIKQAMSYELKEIQDSLNGFRGLAKDFNLPDKWDQRSLNVDASGGEKKKNELIQMVMLNPSIAILDEPDSGLDIDSINTLIKTISEFSKKEEKCVIIISHYEKLLTSFEPETVTVVSNNTTNQYTNNSVITEILSNGFSKYVDI